MPEYDQITIQGQVFRVPLRYAAGHTCTAAEAATLNQTYIEHLRNNFGQRIRGQAPGATPEVLQAQFDEYAAAYQFGKRVPKDSHLDAIALNLAKTAVRDAIREKGNSADYTPAQITELAQALLKLQGEAGKIVETARKQIEAEKEAAREAMASVHEFLASGKP